MAGSLVLDPLLQRAAHLLCDASSAAAKDRDDQVAAKVLADTRRHQENKDFEQLVGLRNGCSVSTNVKDVIEFDEDNHEVAIIVEGDDFDGLDGGHLDGKAVVFVPWPSPQPLPWLSPQLMPQPLPWPSPWPLPWCANISLLN